MKNEQLNEVLERLRETTILANKSLLANSGKFKFDPNIHKWVDTIEYPVDSFISFKGMSVTKTGGTYWLKFLALGELRVALESAKLPIKFCTLLMNTKFRSYVEIQPNDDLNRLFYKSEFFTLHSKRIFDINFIDDAEAENALKKIERLLCFPRLKYP